MEELHRDGIIIGKTTVYRALCHLEKTGVIRKFTVPASDSACYQYAGDNTASCNTHLHLKCMVCGKLYHVDCAHLSELSAHLTAHHGFSVDYAKTVIYGTCIACLSLYPKTEKE